VRLGVSLNSTYVVDDPREAARRMLERGRAASASGLDSLFVGDHHGVPVPYLQNSPVLGRLLADWRGPTAGALYLLPLWHPTIVAEQLGTLAALTDSRIVLQCAVGGSDQFAIMGQGTGDRVRRFETGLDVVRRLLAGETLERMDTPWGPITGSISPVPDHRVDVWIGADADAAIDRAARLGDAWYGGPQQPLGALATTLRAYRDRCAVHGREPSCLPVRRDVYVGADEADVARVVDPVVAGFYRGMDPAALVTGTVEQVVDGLGPLADLGVTDVIVRQLAADQADAVASLERLGAVRAALGDS
jgi:alkanesulfonate monooxygenase SsuD/methylene tetrahydromethanopterin reductase-like flavin-dependent oxidoreductase (luciferase family)